MRHHTTHGLPQVAQVLGHLWLAVRVCVYVFLCVCVRVCVCEERAKTDTQLTGHDSDK